jgi:hypothetical protein
LVADRGIQALVSFAKPVEASDPKPYAAMISLIYRLAIEHGSVSCSSPATLFWRKEDNGRIRFLNQGHPDEDQMFRTAIRTKQGVHLPELDIALNTGMRRSE